MRSFLLPCSIAFGISIAVFGILEIWSLRDNLHSKYEETQMVFQRYDEKLALLEKNVFHHQNSSPLTVVRGPTDATDEENNNSNLINSIYKTLVGFIMSDIPIGIRKYWTYFPHEIELLNQLDENDPALIQHVRNNLIVTPAPKDAPYKFSSDKADFSEGQVAHIRKILKEKRNGFYVECGGCDGEWYSNTIPLERELDWEGILIEADPYMFDKMLQRNRKAWTVPSCISLKKKPTMVSFDRNTFSQGHIGFEKEAQEAAKKTVANNVNVHCMPFSTIMAAFNRTTIDLFSLDIEGHELDILQTIPWDKIDITVLMVEHFQNPPQREPMKNYMIQQGYKVYGEDLPEKWAKENYMFVKVSSGL